MQFVDPAGEPFFYNFRDRAKSAAFPPLTRSDVPHCVLPPRKLEPSAQALCKAGEHLIPGGLAYPHGGSTPK